MKSEFTKNFKLSSLCFYHIICVWERSVVYRGARGRLVSLGLSLASAFWRKVCVCSELYCIMVILYSSINIYTYIYTYIYIPRQVTQYITWGREDLQCERTPHLHIINIDLMRFISLNFSFFNHVLLIIYIFRSLNIKDQYKVTQVIKDSASIFIFLLSVSLNFSCHFLYGHSQIHLLELKS